MIKRLRHNLLLVAVTAMVMVVVAPSGSHAEPESGTEAELAEPVEATHDGWRVRGIPTAPAADAYAHATLSRGVWRIAADEVRFIDGTPHFDGETRIASETSYVTTTSLRWLDERLVAARAIVFAQDWQLSTGRLVIDTRLDQIEFETPGTASALTWRTAPEEH